MNERWQQAYLVIKNDVKQQQKKCSEAPQICPVFLFFFSNFILFLFFSDRKEGTFGVSQKQNDEVFYFSVQFLMSKQRSQCKISVKNNLAMIFPFFKSPR